MKNEGLFVQRKDATRLSETQRSPISRKLKRLARSMTFALGITLSGIILGTAIPINAHGQVIGWIKKLHDVPYGLKTTEEIGERMKTISRTILDSTKVYSQDLVFLAEVDSLAKLYAKHIIKGSYGEPLFVVDRAFAQTIIEIAKNIYTDSKFEFLKNALEENDAPNPNTDMLWEVAYFMGLGGKASDFYYLLNYLELYRWFLENNGTVDKNVLKTAIDMRIREELLPTLKETR